MSKKVIIFNAPPNSGKDYFCEQLAQSDFIGHGSFKEELIKETCHYFDVECTWFSEVHNNRGLKEVPQESLGFRSTRQALIHVSEDIIKPTEGKDYFGRALLKTLLRKYPNTCYNAILISDGGFPEEVFPLVKQYGAENTFIIRMFSDNTSFSGDSRRYIKESEVSCKIIDFYNDRTVSSLFKIHALVRDIINGKV